MYVCAKYELLLAGFPHYEKDPYKEGGKRRGIHMGSEAADKHSDSGVGFSFCRHSVIRSVPSVGSKLIRKLCARPIPGFPLLLSHSSLPSYNNVSPPQFSSVRLLFSFQSHFMSGKIDTRAGRRGRMAMAARKWLELTDRYKVCQIK